VRRRRLLTDSEGATVELLLVAGVAPPLSSFNSDPTSSDLRPGEVDTLSAVSFVKEPLRFCELKPAILSVIQEIHLLVLKTYFFLVNQKYIFWYLQFCH
jgi:hypothetical protein